MEDAESGTVGVPPEPRTPRRRRPFALPLLLALIYLASYGPAVMFAVNWYGQVSPVWSTIYGPANWLANRSDTYFDYRRYWVRHSRHYHWWVGQNFTATDQPMLPPLRRGPASGG